MHTKIHKCHDTSHIVQVPTSDEATLALLKGALAELTPRNFFLYVVSEYAW